ncbi:unnamed protein product [Adineta steineri]|uniref:Calcium-transporting ATPase n=1 Tax=Adineta steineri TaxID=433720 RepID=A0A818XQE4_9BILA|nr:unnamed protein product [Adineta steineri]CAF3740136.1 unnamed protein product [Adineta steineri]
MPFFKKKKSAADEAAGGGGDSSMFDITLDQLKELMEVRGEDLKEKLKSSEYNGVKGILEKLKVDGKKGLDSNNEEDFKQRVGAYGRNEIPPKPMKTFIRLCYEALHDMLLIILLVCAIVSIGLSFYKAPSNGTEDDEPNLEWIEGVAILVAVLVVVFVTAFNDWRKERQFRGLQNKIEKDQQTSVIRDGHIQEIPVAELVVGDLCFIKYGDLLPADGLVVQASDLKIDESSITGETDLVKKGSKDDVGLLSGTNVMEGSGRMVVVGVGLNSQVGNIMSLLGATGGDSKKKKKGKGKDKDKDKGKGKDKDKKKDEKDEKSKTKKPKPLSSTKVSPDKSTSDEKESKRQTTTVETIDETKPSTPKHPRVRKLPEFKQLSTDEQEMKPIKKENNTKQTKEPSSSESSDNDEDQKKKVTKTKVKKEEETKKSSSSESSDSEEKKKSSSSESNDDEQEKKKSTDATVEKPKKSSSNEKRDEEQKKKPAKTQSNNEQEKKKSSTSEINKDKTKKSNSNESITDEQKVKPIKDQKRVTEEKKQSSSGEINKTKSKKTENANDEQQKTSSTTESSSGEEQKKKSTKTETTVKQDKKKSSSNESIKDKPEEKSSSSESSSDEDEEKKSSKNENNDTKQKKKTTKTETVVKQDKKKSSSGESSSDEAEEKVKNSDNDKKLKKKTTKTETIVKQDKKKSSSNDISKDKQEKKSSSSESSSDEEEEKKKKLTKSKSTDSKLDKKSNKNESSDDEEQDKKSKKKKQEESDDDERPSTTSSIQTKIAKDDKKKSGKGKDDNEDSEQKPPGLAALAEDADDDDEGGSNDEKHKSVLQEKLTKLALYIGYIGMAAAVLTLICLIIRFCISNYVVKGNPGSGSDVSYFISFLIQAITVVVVSVPEGLPLAVTLALAYAVRKMMTDNNLVRHLDACETMGNASTICSDKTGTLTTNRMTVVQCYFNGKHYDKLPKKDEIDKDILATLFEGITVNSNYTSKIEKAKDDEGLPKQVGNKTECALLDLIQKWDGSYDEIRKEIPEEKLAKVYTFNSARKMMSTVIEREGGYRLYTKGASEMVLAKCKSIIDKGDKPKELNDHEKKKITKHVIEKMANDGLRTICICYKDLGEEKQNWDDEDKIIKDLICIGIVGIEDPVRDEVPEAIEKCQKAGVVVRMVTGDNITTARSIATKCGIIKPDDDFLVLEGKEFNKRIRDSNGKISQKKLDEIWPKLRVLARSSPTDKYNLVNGIVESKVTAHREVVAVTGDGTNDGPALKRADVGFAMGIQGTDVAKQASDIILTDDNFSSIVKAMMWGRNVYDCIAKFLQFQLTANLSAGVLSVVSAAAISSVPLRAVQMLWVNLVMDTLASLALATEPPTEDLLNRKPYGRTKSIISPMMMRNILGQSIYQLIIMFVILYAGQYFLDVESTVNKIQSSPQSGRELSQQFTLVFNAFVLMTLFNEINSRKLHGERNVFKGIFGNPFFYCIWTFCFVAQILIVTFGDKVFSCARLSIIHWAWSLLFGLGSLAWQQVLLFIPIEPFSKCFSAVYRVCCPCLYKKQLREKDEDKGEDKGERPKSADQKKQKKPSKKSDSDEESDTEHNPPAPGKYATIGHLTNATVVMKPPPIFARYMLRKSVDRLNTEFQVINAFRSRLEAVKDKRNEESVEQKHSSVANIIDEEV